MKRKNWCRQNSAQGTVSLRRVWIHVVLVYAESLISRVLYLREKEAFSKTILACLVSIRNPGGLDSSICTNFPVTSKNTHKDEMEMPKFE